MRSRLVHVWVGKLSRSWAYLNVCTMMVRTINNIFKIAIKRAATLSHSHVPIRGVWVTGKRILNAATQLSR